MFSIFKKSTKFKITDDSGFLAIANPDNYNSFVDEDWGLSQLMNHFVDEMNKETLIIWSTGTSGEWTVLFAGEASKKNAFRAFSKILNITNGKFCLTNYEDLTMAAQFDDNKIPAKHNSNLVIKLNNGQYNFTVRQMFDPLDYNYNPDGKVNFEIIMQAVSLDNLQKVDRVFWSANHLVIKN